MPDVVIPDSWTTDSGMREDMVITIHSSYFAPHADYQDGKVLMLWLLGTDENEDPVEVRLSVGADWTTDDGNVITHPTKKSQHINKNSIYGHWIGYSFQVPELAKVLIERGQELNDLGARDARCWVDLIIHLQTKTIEFGPKVPSQERLMPIEYFGLYVDGQPATVAPNAAPAPSPADVIAAARAAKAASPAASNGSPLYARAVEMAKSAPDFATFLAAALADDEILADDELAVQVADEALVWAVAH
jgi:hypothetical protein